MVKLCGCTLIQVFADTEEAIKWKAILIPNLSLLQDDACSNNDPALSVSASSVSHLAQVNPVRLCRCS
jgi:hypothetical protein